MRTDWPKLVIAAVTGGLAGLAASLPLVRVRPRRLVARNHRGLELPMTVGVAVAIGTAVAMVVVAVWGFLGEPAELAGDVRWLVAGAAVVLVAGLVDDLGTHGGPRGLRGHLVSLARGRPTTGILKVVAAVAAGVACLFGLPDVPISMAGDASGGLLTLVPERTALGSVAIVVVVAGCANLWNGLDVAPARAGKWFVLAGAALLLAGPPVAPAMLLASALGAEAAALPFDLRERGMLGDAGANLLGVVVGFALASRLSGAALVAAAGAVVLLNLLAETVTLSRVIAAVPPLRWFDRLGRR